MACKDRQALLRQLKAGHTLELAKDGCYMYDPIGDHRVEYGFGPVTLVFILLKELGYKGMLYEEDLK